MKPPRKAGSPTYPHMLDKAPTYQDALLELHRLESELHTIHAMVPGRLDVRSIVSMCRVKAKKIRRYLEGEG